MSKKMMKRSLALGALMAFVITGSAMAAELTISSDSDFAKVKNGEIEGWSNGTDIGKQNYARLEDLASDNTLTINNVNAIDINMFVGNIRSAANAITVKNNKLNIGSGKYISNETSTPIGFAGSFVEFLSTKAEVTNHSVVISGNAEIQGDVAASYVTGTCAKIVSCIDAHDNTVTVKDNAKVNSIYGVYAYNEGTGQSKNNTASATVNLKGNSVNVSGGVVNGDVYGAFAESRMVNDKKTDHSATASLDGNSVNVTGGVVNGNVYGAFAVASNTKSTGSLDAQANGNKVNLSGGTITGEVYGGYSIEMTSNYNFNENNKFGGSFETVASTASNNQVNISGTVDVSKANLYGNNGDKDSTGNTLNIGWDGINNKVSAWSGTIGSAQNFDTINIIEGADARFGKKLDVSSAPVVNIDGGTLSVGNEGAAINELTGSDATIKLVELAGSDAGVAAPASLPLVTIGNDKTEKLTLTASAELFAEGSDSEAKLQKIVDAVQFGSDSTGSVNNVKITGDAVYDEISADFTAGSNGNELGTIKETVASTNIDINNAAAIGLMAWRAETNDMNKRLGELRNANGDLGVWVRMVRGESEYKTVKHQYNQYQLGYDEKLSTDPSWTVGAALSYTDGESSYAKGNGENTHKGLAIYGSKINDDGSFIDLIAKYSRLDNDFKAADAMGDGEYDANAYSFSAEYGKRIQKGNGLWIEPQVELTYGKVAAVDYVTSKGVNVAQDGMESLVGRIGFSLGKDIKDGNVYARASYLYDFNGEAETVLNGKEYLKEDLGGGWWEVGVGANINLSKATYIYADVEKTFGGEVDTNWQWNLGVRYSF